MLGQGRDSSSSCGLFSFGPVGPVELELLRSADILQASLLTLLHAAFRLFGDNQR